MTDVNRLPSQPGDTIARPDSCPSCQGRVIDTLAKVITATTTWRCRVCEHTWTIASLKAKPPVHF